MSADRVETEWHLTPRGWEEGKDGTPPPSDRVMTVAEITVWPSQWNSQKIEKRDEERWRSGDAAKVAELLAKFPRYSANWKPLR